ncbi:MAG: hypothetical protein U0694_28760 [Anaerolineae bacterium]
MSNDKRYQEILRRIEAQKRAKESGAQRVTLSAALDSLNALGMLDDVRITDRPGWVCWGPLAFEGKDWLAALVWCKPATYHGYRQLTVLGIWAQFADTAIDITLATKTLAFTAPFYEAEAYHKLMRGGFDTYYNDKGAPPEESGWLYHSRYDADKRLEMRAALKAALLQWAQRHT